MKLALPVILLVVATCTHGAKKIPTVEDTVTLNGGTNPNIAASDKGDNFAGNVNSAAKSVNGQLPPNWRRQGAGTYQVGDNGNNVFANEGSLKNKVDISNNGNTFDTSGDNGKTQKLVVQNQGNNNYKYDISTSDNDKVSGVANKNGNTETGNANVNGKQYNAVKQGTVGTASQSGGNSHTATGLGSNTIVADDKHTIKRNNSGASADVVQDRGFLSFFRKPEPKSYSVLNGPNPQNNAETLANVDSPNVNYNSIANSNEKSSRLVDKNGQEVTKVTVLDTTQNDCDAVTYDNKFSDERDEFEIVKDSVRTEFVPKKNASGTLVYEWPSCMRVTMLVKLPPGVLVEQVAAQIEVDMPLRSKFYCDAAYNCGTRNCFYKDLCNKGVTDRLEKTVPVNKVLANSDQNACTNQNGRQLPFEAFVCPADQDVKDNTNAFRTNTNILDPVYDDVQATIKLYTITPQFECKTGDNVFSGLFASFLGKGNEPVLVACQTATTSYEVSWYGQTKFSQRQEKELLGGVQGIFTSPRPVAPTACKPPSYCTGAFASFLAACKNPKC